MKTTKTFFTVSVLFSVLLISGCSGGGTVNPGNAENGGSTDPTANSVPGNPGEQVSVAGGSFTRLSPVELRGMKNKKDFPLVNVHIPFAGNLPGTDLSIPYNEIEKNLDKLPANKDAKIVLYCQGGPMSFDAARTLVRLGYTNVSDLNGGMDAWQNAGFQLKGA